MAKYRHEKLTREIINAAYTVHNSLGYGFLERVYHNALILELEHRQIVVERQKRLPVFCLNQSVGEFIPDIVVDGRVVIRGQID